MSIPVSPFEPPPDNWEKSVVEGMQAHSMGSMWDTPSFRDVPPTDEEGEEFEPTDVDNLMATLNDVEKTERALAILARFDDLGGLDLEHILEIEALEDSAFADSDSDESSTAMALGGRSPMSLIVEHLIAKKLEPNPERWVRSTLAVYLRGKPVLSDLQRDAVYDSMVAVFLSAALVDEEPAPSSELPAINQQAA